MKKVLRLLYKTIQVGGGIIILQSFIGIIESIIVAE